ncbi:MAG: class I SAM-dependent methyltransferase [Desulfobacteraceae bacterium]|nr:class I SAM-dependent methyltransferase [Desulfobacteraceae bacterium]
MKFNKSSRTATGIAICRARESARPENARICYDPYARHFIPLSFKIIVSIPFLRDYLRQKRQKRSPGILEAIVARVRYMDDYLLNCIDQGLEQFVSLGAGYDTRPYRIDGLKNNIRIFEVDHPATQQVKKNKIKKIFGSLPAHVKFVPVRFNSQNLGEELLNNGYDRTLKTLFVWEGVAMYLTPEAVDNTLSFIMNNSAPSSSIIFDYIPLSTVEGPNAPREGKVLKKEVAKKGEELIFAIEPEDIKKFLVDRGFENIETLNAQDLRKRYFKGINANRKISRVLNFVHATVKGRIK